MSKKTPANKGKVCIRRKRASNGKMKCAAFGAPTAKPKKRTGRRKS